MVLKYTCVIIAYQGILVSQAIFFVVFAHFMSIKTINVVYGCARHPDLRNGRISPGQVTKSKKYNLVNQLSNEPFKVSGKC